MASETKRGFLGLPLQTKSLIVKVLPFIVLIYALYEIAMLAFGLFGGFLFTTLVNSKGGNITVADWITPFLIYNFSVPILLIAVFVLLRKRRRLGLLLLGVYFISAIGIQLWQKGITREFVYNNALLVPLIINLIGLYILYQIKPHYK